MNIFVSVGTHEKGFPRLINLISEIRYHEVTVQIGSTEIEFSTNSNIKSFDFCSFDKMRMYAVKSDVIIGSASPGLANLAWNNDCVYIGFPRLREFNEAVDDHQVDFANFLAQLGGCLRLDMEQNINSLIKSIDQDKSTYLIKQKRCQDIFNQRMKSVRKSVQDFFAQ